MLKLVNVSRQRCVPYGRGRQFYELRVNERFLCEVEHCFEDGASELLRRAADALDKVDPPSSSGPYISKTVTTKVRLYNKDYGDNRICKCGHTYDRHFDGFEHPDHQAVGCKYCDCYTFERHEDAEPN